MIQLNKTCYNIDKVRLEIDMLTDEHGWGNRNQLSLQSPDGNFETGDGKIEYHPGMAETDFTSLNLDPDWEISKFISDNNLYRTRIMKLLPKQCYSYHWDRTPRVHLAVDTHEHCFISIDDKLVHVPSDGYAYWIDTRKYHTAMNCTLDFERVHIVGCTQMTFE